jgi:hypothetical protein
MPIQILPKHIQEALVALYLRLNDYFTSGHIIHADCQNPAVRERGEIDVYAIRLPYSREPETGVPPSDYLDLENDVLDIIVGEVKSRNQPIQFNPSTREPDNIVRFLRRAGFTRSEVIIFQIAHTLSSNMTPQPLNRPSDRIEIILEPLDDIMYTTRIRPIIFHLGRELPNKNQAWFVGYKEIMNDIWQRLRPELQPEGCQRVYDKGLWGPVFEAIVEYFKDESRLQPGTPDDLLHELIG